MQKDQYQYDTNWMYLFVAEMRVRTPVKQQSKQEKINLTSTVWSLLFYISINVIGLDTVDFTECDPILRITTLRFSECISPFSETDDVVHNVILLRHALPLYLPNFVFQTYGWCYRCITLCIYSIKSITD